MPRAGRVDPAGEDGEAAQVVRRGLAGGLQAHDARPLDHDRPVPDDAAAAVQHRAGPDRDRRGLASGPRWEEDRKSTRLNSSHGYISYAVFCLKKKKSSPHYYI